MQDSIQLYPCNDCMALVGAGPATRPHAHLQALPCPYGRDVVRCERCGSLWMLRKLGWARAEVGVGAEA